MGAMAVVRLWSDAILSGGLSVAAAPHAVVSWLPFKLCPTFEGSVTIMPGNGLWLHGDGVLHLTISLHSFAINGICNASVIPLDLDLSHTIMRTVPEGEQGSVSARSRERGEREARQLLLQASELSMHLAIGRIVLLLR